MKPFINLSLTYITLFMFLFFSFMLLPPPGFLQRTIWESRIQRIRCENEKKISSLSLAGKD